MFDENEYKETFSKVTASRQTKQEVMDMTRIAIPESNSRFIARRIAAVVTAILILTTLSVTALAAMNGAKWFESFFDKKTNDALSGGQISYIEENTSDLGLSVTHNGYTVTVESALTDGFTAFIKVKLTAPENVVLDADDYWFTYKNKPTFYPADGSDPPRTSSSKLMEDEDPQDNVVYWLHIWRSSGLNAGAEWILELEDLVECTLRDDGFHDETLIAEGVFQFSIVLSDGDTEEVELLDVPIPCTARVYESNSEYTEVDVTITSIVLRPMSANIIFENYKDSYRLAGFGQMTVVMKDGSQVSMNLSSGGNYQNKYAMNVPIALDEVDHLLLPDGTKLLMPESTIE